MLSTIRPQDLRGLPITLGGHSKFIPYLGIGPDGLPALGTGVGTELLKALDTAVASFLLHILLPMQRGTTIVAVETLGHGAHSVAAGTCSEAEDNMAELRAVGSLGHPNGGIIQSQAKKLRQRLALLSRRGLVPVGKKWAQLNLAMKR